MPGRTWLQAHIDDVKYMGKPLVLEEFGKAVGELLGPNFYIAKQEFSRRFQSGLLCMTSIGCGTPTQESISALSSPVADRGQECFIHTLSAHNLWARYENILIGMQDIYAKLFPRSLCTKCVLE